MRWPLVRTILLEMSIATILGLVIMFLALRPKVNIPTALLLGMATQALLTALLLHYNLVVVTSWQQGLAALFFLGAVLIYLSVS